MPKARKHQISLDATSYYHCTSRCVRRAFLCGVDRVSGKSYEHRRDWIEDRIHALANVFCINVCAYAVMSNHLHVVLHVDQELALSLSHLDICERWHSLFKGTELTKRFHKGDALTPAEYDAVIQKLELWREQLISISWFMRCLNEPIARQANFEDNCTGSFWEGRFTCQALLDEKALAACMAYVDLNPIRADIATTPETSDYTSVKHRIDTLRVSNKQPATLHPFVGNPRKNMPKGLPFNLDDYFALVDWTGRQVKPNKRGVIDDALPPILTRLKFDTQTRTLVGHPKSIAINASQFGYKRLPPTRQSRLFLH